MMTVYLPTHYDIRNLWILATTNKLQAHKFRVSAIGTPNVFSARKLCGGFEMLRTAFLH